MKLAITGALGHIGSRLIRTIRPGEFDEVLLIDNLSTLRYCSLFELPKDVAFRFVECDVTTSDLDSLLRGCDVVIHLAAITDAMSSFDKADEVRRVNLGGTERVAKACLTNRCSMIFASTTSVYGVQAGEVDEGCREEELKPQSPYASSKLEAERLLASLGRSAGLRFVVCRLGTIFGISPGMRFHTAVNKFCWQAVVGQPITVWKTALHQKRPYLDLGDAIRAFRHIVATGLFDNGVYNVVTVNATVSDILEILRALVPDMTVEHVETRIMNQLSYTVSNQRFRDSGFRFTGDLERGIGDTIRLFDGIRRRQQD